MKAIGLATYGGPDVLNWFDLPDPHAGPGQVRIRVRAASVNPVDAMLREGLLAVAYEGPDPPYIPGLEVAGTIDETGDDVDGITVGEEVVGFVDNFAQHGGYSQYVVLPAASVIRKPAGTTFAQAASFLNNALTARNALDTLNLQPGATLLVTGAAGAVGGYLAQLGTAEGLRIVAVAAASARRCPTGSMGSPTRRCCTRPSSPSGVTAGRS